jgi:hypothetical protein
VAPVLAGRAAALAHLVVLPLVVPLLVGPLAVALWELLAAGAHLAALVVEARGAPSLAQQEHLEPPVARQVEPDDALVVAVVLPLLWLVALAVLQVEQVEQVEAGWPLTGLNRAMAEQPMALQVEASLIETPVAEVPLV